MDFLPFIYTNKNKSHHCDNAIFLYAACPSYFCVTIDDMMVDNCSVVASLVRGTSTGNTDYIQAILFFCLARLVEIVCYSSHTQHNNLG